MPDARLYEERAPRMQIQLPLRYREPGTATWHQSMTQNISRTGVLFAAPCSFQPGALLEIDLRLPPVRPISPDGARFTSLARVIRSAAVCSTGISLAVQFLEYQFSKHIAPAS